MRYDVVIIGSGLGGLECGYILSRAGKRVLVLEQGAQPGGCVQSYRRRGLAYDTGFHYVGGLAEGQSLHSSFKYLGLLDLPWWRLDAEFDRVDIGGRQFAFSQGFDAFAATLAEDFPAEREALKSYARMLSGTAQRQYDVFNPQTARAAMSSMSDLETGAYAYLERTFADRLLIDVLGGTSMKMELLRDTLPLFTFTHAGSSFIESSWRLRGDGSLIVDALADGIRSFGGEIVCMARVDELVEKNGLIDRAVCANGEEYEGALFVSDIHPASTCDLVKRSDKIRSIYRNRLHRLQNTFGMFTVSLRIKPRALRYFNFNQYVYKRANVWTFHQERGAVGGVMVSCRVPEDGGEWTDQVDLLTPMLYADCERWADTSVGRRGDDYSRMKAEKADECVALAERFIPGLRGMVEERYTSTPLTYRDYTGTPEGSAYGLRKDCTAPIVTLLSPRTPVANLLLTGQNLMLHGLHGVTMSSFMTSAEVLGKDYVWNIMKP